VTVFFAYENLTWPEINALPRNTPLILPLGRGYARESLSKILEDPPRIGLLPPFPYGWTGSRLEIPGSILVAFLENLIKSLQEERFSCVYVLIPEGLDLDLKITRLALPLINQEPNSAIFPTDADLGKVIIIPVGHTEQHGFHLPMSTDTLIIEAIGKGTAQAASEQSFCLPVMPYGVSTHRAAFAGTLNAGGRAFEDFFLAVLDELVARGFDRYYLNSGHGGNSSFLVNVVKYAGEKHRHIFCATSWLYLSGAEGIAALEKYRQSPIGGMGHACELETSLILYLRPELVHMDRVIDEMDFISTSEYYMDWVEGGALIANPPWDDDTRTGAYGAGSLGTAVKGRLWLESAISEKVKHIFEIHEQYARRTARRKSGYGLWGQDQSYK
jgi:creatinine amidohydrolase